MSIEKISRIDSFKQVNERELSLDSLAFIVSIPYYYRQYGGRGDSPGYSMRRTTARKEKEIPYKELGKKDSKIFEVEFEDCSLSEEDIIKGKSETIKIKLTEHITPEEFLTIFKRGNSPIKDFTFRSNKAKGKTIDELSKMPEYEGKYELINLIYSNGNSKFVLPHSQWANFEYPDKIKILDTTEVSAIRE